LGLKELGVTLVEDGDPQPPNFVYANDEPRWQEAIDYSLSFTSAPERPQYQITLLLNVLDIPEHSPNCDFGALDARLSKATSITCISPFVHSQIQRIFGFNAAVIWNPIKAINSDERKAGVKKYPYRFLMAGRLRDPGKRAELAIRALIAAGVKEEEVAVVGGEWPNWGTNLGIVDDEKLNSLYNSVDFVMMTSQFEGLGLPCAESLAGGAVPILCSDLTTLQDLGVPRRWGCYPSVYSLGHWILTLLNNPALLASEKQVAEQIGQTIRTELSGRRVAERLLQVYQQFQPQPS
jgi:glycosyltransferase involved in cell wall biosynthesis